MNQSYSSKAGDVAEKFSDKQSASARKAAESASDDVQADLERLRDDVAKLSQQLAKFAAAKGNEAWWLAKDNLDEVIGSAQAKGREAAEAVDDIRDNLTSAIDDSLEQRPYTTLAVAMALGFVAGAIWKR